MEKIIANSPGLIKELLTGAKIIYYGFNAEGSIMVLVKYPSPKRYGLYESTGDDLSRVYFANKIMASPQCAAIKKAIEQFNF